MLKRFFRGMFTFLLNLIIKLLFNNFIKTLFRFLIRFIFPCLYSSSMSLLINWMIPLCRWRHLRDNDNTRGRDVISERKKKHNEKIVEEKTGRFHPKICIYNECGRVDAYLFGVWWSFALLNFMALDLVSVRITTR